MATGIDTSITFGTSRGGELGATSQVQPTSKIVPTAVPEYTSLQITTHKLNGKNYLEWSQSVKLAIDGRGKLGYLTGEIQKPKETDPTYKAWRSENSLVTAWLLNSMEGPIAKPHLFLPTAKEVWDAA